MKKVSIIVPVYNAENYIEKCVESIVNQTYENIEIILIDDGSKDNSLNKIKLLADKYNIIRYYSQKNQGVAKTRNDAIKYSKGEYLMFVDNDDYLDKDYVETFVKNIEIKNYDFVIGGFRRVNHKGKTLYTQIYEDLPWSYFMFSTPWARIFNREFLIKNNIEFLPVKVGEDLHFNVMAISFSQNKKIINYVGYNQLYNEKSVSNTVHKKNTKNNNKDIKYLFSEILKNCNQTYLKENSYYIKYFFLKTVIWYTLFSCKGGNANEALMNYHELINWVNTNYSNCYKKISLNKPKGERLFTRLIIKIFTLLDKIKLLKIFLKIYVKI